LIRDAFSHSRAEPKYYVFFCFLHEKSTPLLYLGKERDSLPTRLVVKDRKGDTPMAWTDAELQDVIAEVSRRATIDPEFRRLALNDAAAAISRITQKALPWEVTFKFVDNSGPVKTIALPDPVVDIFERELSESELEAVAGGDFSVTANWSKKPKAPPPPKPPTTPA
jgi:hypothetical protein